MTQSLFCLMGLLFSSQFTTVDQQPLKKEIAVYCEKYVEYSQFAYEAFEDFSNWYSVDKKKVD